MKSYVNSQPTTQYSATNAWNVNLNNGNVNNNTKTNGNQVRLISDFCNNPDTPEMRDFLDFAASMIEAYILCLSNKRSNPNAAFFALRGLTASMHLAEEIWSGSYAIAPGIIFVVRRPVPREVCAATFRDRVVHVWVMSQLEPVFEALFPDAIMANRKGRGTMGAIIRTDTLVRETTEGYTRDAWVYTTDFQGFFMGLDKRIVNAATQEIIDRYHTGPWRYILKHLFATITFNRPQLVARRRSPDSEWDLIAPSKSLYHCDRWHGLAIGNLPSQWSACLMIMLALRILERHGIPTEQVVSYMDDTIIVLLDKVQFLAELPAIERELKEELNITLHPRKRNLQHYSKGWKIVGGKGRMGRLYASDRTIRRFRAKMHYLCTEVHDPQAAFASLNSYLGTLSKFRTRKVRAAECEKALAVYGKEMYAANDYLKVVLRSRYNTRHMTLRRIRLARSYNHRRLARLAA